MFWELRDVGEPKRDIDCVCKRTVLRRVFKSKLKMLVFVDYIFGPWLYSDERCCGRHINGRKLSVLVLVW